MGTRDPRVDAYIADAAPFARPILRHLRKVVHAACPDVVETIKWRMPFFTYHGLFCYMAAFRQHCGFGIWRGSQVVKKSAGTLPKSMGNFGRITKVADLPASRSITTFLKAVMRMKENALKQAPAKKRKARS
jgi:hypothetical protein